MDGKSYKLVVLPSGFVYIGRLHRTDGIWLRLTDAVSVRRWNNGSGIPGVCHSPTSVTVDGKDHRMEMDFPIHSLISVHAIDMENWSAVLGDE